MLFKDYLTKLKYNQFHHSLIIKPRSCCDYLKISKDFLKTLICKEQNPYCDHCFYCNKVNNDAYVDFIYLNNNNDEAISKQDILDLQQKFIKPGVEEANVKLYVITNFDQVNKQIANSLLKFIEEAPKNTYCLLFSTNPNNIIKTIVSRSNIINIDDQIDDTNIEFKDEVINVFNDYNEYLAFVEKYNIEDIIKLSDEINNIQNIVNEVTFSKQLTTLSRYEFYIFLKLILNKVSINKKIKIMEFINDLKLNMNQKNIIIKLLKILKESNNE